MPEKKDGKTILSIRGIAGGSKSKPLPAAAAVLFLPKKKPVVKKKKVEVIYIND